MKVPLLAGTRVHVVDAPADSVVLRPPPPGEAVLDVGAAVQEALRYPLTGDPIDALAPRGGRATIVVEPPALPIPGSPHDPRRDALAATVGELERVGVPLERQTLLVAGGLARRLGPRDLDSIVSPELARRFRGRVEVHDAAAPDLVDLGFEGHVPLRVNRALVETDVVAVVSAAQTVLHGGPAALVAASGAETLRAANAYSLVETAASTGWRSAVALERALAERVRLVGVSLALNHPSFGGPLHGYPYDSDALGRVASSPLRFAYGALPGPARARVLRALPTELTVSAVYAGPPSVAHAETLLRSVEVRSAVLDEPVDALCIAVPRATAHLPRERPNPLQAAYVALGLALRLWRDAFPVVDGGALIVMHRFIRAFAHPSQQPYRVFFGASRWGRDPEELAAGERAAASDPRALDAYRSGRAHHPVLPFADWAACAPALSRLGVVLVAGCRDAAAARQLGFVPVQNVATSLEMVRGTLGREPRLGILVTPPFFPIRVGSLDV